MKNFSFAPLLMGINVNTLHFLALPCIPSLFCPRLVSPLYLHSPLSCHHFLFHRFLSTTTSSPLSPFSSHHFLALLSSLLFYSFTTFFSFNSFNHLSLHSIISMSCFNSSFQPIVALFTLLTFHSTPDPLIFLHLFRSLLSLIPLSQLPLAFCRASFIILLVGTFPTSLTHYRLLLPPLFFLLFPFDYSFPPSLSTSPLSPRLLIFSPVHLHLLPSFSPPLPPSLLLSFFSSYDSLLGRSSSHE